MSDQSTDKGLLPNPNNYLANLNGGNILIGILAIGLVYVIILVIAKKSLT